MNRLSECKNLLQNTQQRILSSTEEWKAFLRFYSKIYKYDYTSALLIYARRPDASALAPLSLWNRIGRRVNAGAKGIPVIADDSGYQTLQYLFDVSDTSGAPNTLPVPWKLNRENQDIMFTDLEDRYGITSFSPFFEPRMTAIIEFVLNSDYNEYISFFHDTVQGSDLAFLPDEEMNTVLYDLLSDSVTYMVYSRAFPDSPLLNALKFDGLTLLNLQEHTQILGNTAAHHTNTLLRQIESSVRQFDHEKLKEKRRLNYDSRVQGKGRPALSGSGNSGAEGRGTIDEIRNGVQEIFAGDGSNPIRDTHIESEAHGEMPSGRTGSERVRGQSADQPTQRTPSATDGGPHAAAAVQQLAVQDGGGNDNGEHLVQKLKLNEPDKTAAPLESGAAVFTSIESNSLNDRPEYGSFVPEEEFINNYLAPQLDRTVFVGGKQRIYDFLNTSPTVKEAISFIKQEYGVGGGSATFSNGREGFYQTDAKGFKIDVKLPEGDYSRTVSWNTTAQVIRQLINEGRYLDGVPAPKKQQLSLFDFVSTTDIETKSGTSSAFESTEKTPETSGVDHMLEQAEGIAATSAVEPYERFSVIETDNGSKTGTSSAFVQSPVIKNNFHYDSFDEFTGGQKTHYRANLEALQLLKTLDSDHRQAEPEEQKVLSRYLGWGGIPQAFDAGNQNWQKEYAELKNLLSPESYEAARASTLTAFYTPPAVISAVHTILKNAGFTGGNVLEPSCATGRFFGFLPPEVEKSCNLYGVELDSASGTIAQQLYPNATIQVKGFEKAAFPDNFFDVSIGNVPFGEYKLNDSRYNKQNLLIHDYFFAKTLDKVRPGGLILFVTSKGTMDKANNQFRKYIAQRAELVGAIRFPNTMMQTEANTKVTADLIVLKKRDRMVDIEPDWVNLTSLDNGVPVNTYFADHPEMMLGTMVFDDSMYGSKNDTALLPHENSDWREELHNIVEQIHVEYEEQEVELQENEVTVSIPADPNVKNFSYTISEGNIYYRENAQMILQNLSGMREQRIRGMISLRDAMREVIRVQSEDFPEGAITQTQAELNRIYDEYVRKYGYLTSTANKQAFSLDTDYPLLTSLENVDDSGAVTKAAIFERRTIRPPMVITHCETAVEALTVCMDRKGEVDLDYAAELTGKSRNDVYSQLIGHTVFKNPESERFETADDYLSGNVREKLNYAVDAAQNDEQYLINVESLKKVQPEDIGAAQIDLRLGSPLLSSDDIQQFICDLLKPSAYNANHLKIHFVPSQALWKINGVYHAGMQNDMLAGRTYGTHRMDGYELIELLLNQKTPTIRDKKADDSYVVNTKETAAAREKQRVIDHKFSEWVFKDPKRRERLVQKYNQVYNNIRLRKYDGSYLTFPGMTPEISLMPHQKNAVARILRSGNTLLAHCVGAGKTYTMIAAAMESKRLGLCSKSMFVVPGHLIDQWGADILKLYPGANVLLATKKDFEKKNRQKLVSKIATGDYDAIVIAQSSFEKIPINPERIERLLRKQINDIVESMDLAKSERDEDWSIKNMERTKKALEDQLQRLLDQSKKDNLLTFEQLGVDQIFIDEAHYYKNLFVPTKMSNVAGIGQQKAQKASDLQMKCQYINELHGGMRGVVFATGTPISNSMSEMFTMQTYLEPDELVQRTLSHFDSWAAQFGRVTSSLELTPDGTQYRYKARFAEFVNLPELMSVYSLVSDIQTADMLHLPVPKLKTGRTITIVAQPSDAQKEYVDEIVSRFEVIHSGGVQPWEDNALKATNDGRNAALDMRLVDQNAEDFEGSKVNLATENIFEIWQRTSEKRLTQMIFCDLSTPKYIQMKTVDGISSIDSHQFSSVYEDMKLKLICKGIPESEIAFIHDANTETQKEQLFSDFRAGKVRILFGSTARMGAGTNAQRKLVALHHMDAPWRPADLEQRDGRILRQGNENPEVEIYRYVTEGTFDAYSWQILEQKQRFISQVSRGEVVERHAADIDDTALDYATVKMLASKDPRIKEREELRVRVAELSQLKAQDNSERYSLEDSVMKDLPQRISRNTEAIENLTKDIALRDSNASEEFHMIVGNQTYIKREQAGVAILKKANTFHKSGEYLPIGEYMGFGMELTYSAFSMNHSLVLCGAARHRTDLGLSEIGCVARIDNLLKDFEGTISRCKQDIDYAKQQMAEANAQLSVPWEHEQEFVEKSEQLNRLDIALSSEMGNDEQVLDTEPDQSIENLESTSLEEKLQNAKAIAGNLGHENTYPTDRERD